MHVPYPLDNDPILRATLDSCPRRDAIWADRRKHSFWLNKVAESANLFKRLTNYSGRSINENNLRTILDISRAEHAQGFHVPEWVGEKWREMTDFEQWTFGYQYRGNDELARLVGGPFLSKIIEDMQNVRSHNHTKIPKMNIFTGHEHSILGLAAALGFIIDFSAVNSCVMVELYHHRTFGYIIELYYHTKGRFIASKVPGCGYSCLFDRFVKLTANRTSHDRKKECGL